MAFTYTVTSDIKKATATILEKHRRQIRFATLNSINKVGERVVKKLKTRTRREIDRPTPFTVRGIKFKKARPTKLRGTIYVMPIQWEYLRHIVEPNIRHPKKKFIGVPVQSNLKINKFGNVVGKGSSKGGQRSLVKNPDTMFVGKHKGVLGVWERGRRGKGGAFSARRKTGDKTLRLLWTFKPKTKYRRTFRYFEHADRTINKWFVRDFNSALRHAIRTAK